MPGAAGLVAAAVVFAGSAVEVVAGLPKPANRLPPVAGTAAVAPDIVVAADAGAVDVAGFGAKRLLLLAVDVVRAAVPVALDEPGAPKEKPPVVAGLLTSVPVVAAFSLSLNLKPPSAPPAAGAGAVGVAAPLAGVLLDAGGPKVKPAGLGAVPAVAGEEVDVEAWLAFSAGLGGAPKEKPPDPPVDDDAEGAGFPKSRFVEAGAVVDAA